MSRTLEVFGYIGAAMLIIAYALLSFDSLSHVPHRQLIAQSLNFFGNAPIIYIAFRQKAMPNFVIGIFWYIVTVIALISIALA